MALGRGPKNEVSTAGSVIAGHLFLPHEMIFGELFETFVGKNVKLNVLLF